MSSEELPTDTSNAPGSTTKPWVFTSQKASFAPARVKATVFFRGREIAHPDIGRRILERLISELADEAVTESMPRMEGNTMHTIFSRKPGARPQAPKPAPKPAQSEA